MALKEYRMDLHIHTCLSPCAEPEMLPSAIIEQARNQNLDAIGICDHNTADNVTAVRKAGQRGGVYVLGGMEICSSEEIHIMGFFDDDEALSEMQNVVQNHLAGENDEAYFGAQPIVDENDSIVGSSKRLLIGSTDLAIDEIVDSVHALGGLAVASHIDRPSFSIISQLGFISEELPLDALELSWKCPANEVEAYRSHQLPLVQSSDAHFLADIGKGCTTFLLAEPSFSEVAMAFRGVQERSLSI